MCHSGLQRVGVSFDIMRESLEEMQVKGRVEQICTGKGTIILIDYAHNAMSLQSILEMVHSYHPQSYYLHLWLWWK